MMVEDDIKVVLLTFPVLGDWEKEYPRLPASQPTFKVRKQKSALQSSCKDVCDMAPWSCSQCAKHAGTSQSENNQNHKTG